MEFIADLVEIINWAWAIAFAFIGIGASMGVRKPWLAYKTHGGIRVAAVVMMLLLGVTAIYVAMQTASHAKLGFRWMDRRELFGLVWFWAFFPPMALFMEFYCYDCGVIEIPPVDESDPDVKPEKDKFMSLLNNYARLAANVWAAFAAVIAAILSQAK